MNFLLLSLRGQYKGLKDQTFCFNQAESSIIAFIGLNGSGKSQLLELIAEIFAFLERKKRRDFGVKTPLSFGFETTYNINETSFKVALDKGSKSPRISILKMQAWENSSIDELELPYVVGYASGLNENLQRGFMKNAVKFYEVMRIRHNRRKELFDIEGVGPRAEINRRYLDKYPNIFSERTPEANYADYFFPEHEILESDTPASKSVYLDYDSAGLMLLCLAIIPAQDADDLLSEITFKKPTKAVLQYDIRVGAAEEDAIRDIKMLIRAAGNRGFKGIGQRASDQQFEMYELEYLAGQITLELTDNDVIDDLRENNYNDPLTLFRRLYKLQQLGVKNWQRDTRSRLQKDNFLDTVKKPLKTKLPLSITEIMLSDGNGRSVRFDDLSDGEAQLIQVLATVRIFSKESALFLLDEPETHLNPAWRTFFYGHLREAMRVTGEGSEKSQVFLSTHSPFMISSLKRNNVYCFKREENHQITMTSPQNETYGASFDVLIKDLFGMRSLISQSVITEIREQLNYGDAHAKEWIQNNLGLSAERAYMIRKLSQ